MVSPLKYKLQNETDILVHSTSRKIFIWDLGTQMPWEAVASEKPVATKEQTPQLH